MDPGGHGQRGIANAAASNPVSVRETGPNAFYLGADRAEIDPPLAPPGDSRLWAAGTGAGAIAAAAAHTAAGGRIGGTMVPG